MRLVILLAIACSSSPPPPPPSSTVPPPPPKPYTGDPARGPCHAVDECKLRSVCGCSCEAVRLSEPSGVNCDESCANEHICDKYSLICDLPTQTCGAIPK